QLEPFGRRIALYTDVQLVCKRASACFEQTRDDFLFAVAHAVVRSNWDLPYHRCSNGYGGGAVPCRKSGRALVFVADQLGPQVIFVRLHHLGADDVAGLHARFAVKEHAAVDLWRIPGRAADGAFLIDLVDQHLDGAALLLAHQIAADLLLCGHEAMPALLLDLLRHGARQVIGGSALDGLVLEAADAVEPRFLEPVEKQLEILFRLAREADDERGANSEVRTDLAPTLDALQSLFLRGRPAHGAQHSRAGVLEGNVKVGQHLAL